MDEATLITAARNGCEDAFATLHKKHLPAVRAVGRAVLHTNDLDDLCQETFLLAFTRIHSFQGNSNFRTWLTRIAMNQCLMILRRSRQVTNGALQLLQLDTDATADGCLEQYFFTVEDQGLRSIAARLDLPKYLETLKPSQRKILEMAYLEELSDQEIAARSGVTLASVKSKIHHAKRRLREAHKKR